MIWLTVSFWYFLQCLCPFDILKSHIAEVYSSTGIMMILYARVWMEAGQPFKLQITPHFQMECQYHPEEDEKRTSEIWVAKQCHINLKENIIWTKSDTSKFSQVNKILLGWLRMVKNNSPIKRLHRDIVVLGRVWKGRRGWRKRYSIFFKGITHL